MKKYVIVFVKDESRILMVLKNRPAKMAGRLNLPGGKVEPTDADSLAAAYRELKEEAGLDAKSLKYFGKIIVEKDELGYDVIIDCIEAVVDPSQQISPRPEETEIVSWHEWSLLMNDDRLMPNLRVIIPLVYAGISDWTIVDTQSSCGKKFHNIEIQLPTCYKVAN